MPVPESLASFFPFLNIFMCNLPIANEKEEREETNGKQYNDNRMWT